jgi:deoxyadenosine/deoxycytidine kinase
VAGFDLSPVLTIKSDDLDFVHKQPHLETVVRRIDKILAGKEEMEFPRLGG